MIQQAGGLGVDAGVSQRCLIEDGQRRWLLGRTGEWDQQQNDNDGRQSAYHANRLLPWRFD